eukprot:GDKI01035891.1.p2 GENE.GDKI01035891.1~~GDKI01035891.1.p2  ORF type:complete len:113 (-),score=39.79 GDKI01035891.1:77-415(-)
MGKPDGDGPAPVDNGDEDDPNKKKKDEDAGKDANGGDKPKPKPDEKPDGGAGEKKNVPLWLFLVTVFTALSILLMCGLGCLTGALKVHTHTQTGEHYLFVFGRQFCTFGGRA